MGIAARSTNTKGSVHFGGEIVSGVEDGVGVIVGTASTGAVVYVEPFADSTASIGLRAKTTGKVQIGNSSNTVDIAGSAITFTGAITAPKIGAASTTALTLVQQYVVEFTPPALAASTSAESTYAVTGLTTNCAILLAPRDPLSPAYTYQARCSTADELVIRWGNLFGSTIGTGESTNRFRVLTFSI